MNIGMQKNSINLKLTFISLIKLLLPLVFLFIAIKLMYRGIGFQAKFLDILAFALLIITFGLYRKLFFIVGGIIILCYTIYTPIGLSFGDPSYQYVVSFLSTNLIESNEFLSLIPLKNWIYAFSIPACVFLFYKLNSKNNLKVYKNKLFFIATVIILVINQSPFLLFQKLYVAIKEVRYELAQLETLLPKSDWQDVALDYNKSKYDDYVLIIGESARKDYLHEYGYPIENTPFISQSRATIIDGLTSAGTNTVASLRLMLTENNRSDWTPNYNLNLIDLINQAGISTYWISNQGYVSKYDSPVTAIAKKSHAISFLNSGSFESSNRSDFELLAKFKNFLTDNNMNKKRFFVIHIMGSHPDVCQRITDVALITKIEDQNYDYLNCYVTSIYKTDKMIEELYKMLDQQMKTNGRTFSLIYFSDHGLSHDFSVDKIKLNLSYTSKYHYDIPLIKLSSDDKEKVKLHSFKSGLNFTNGIANWMGIDSKQLDIHYDLFDGVNDNNDYGLFNKIKLNNNHPDPAIDINGK